MRIYIDPTAGGQPPQASRELGVPEGSRPALLFRDLLPITLLLPLAAAGCSRSDRQVATAEPPRVAVSKPVVRKITDQVDFTGRTDAVESVQIRPRVTGYLVKLPFKEGAEVKAGDLLFEIDPRPYEAQLKQAESQVSVFEAQYKLAKVTQARDRAADARALGSVSAQQLDQDMATLEEAEARRNAYKASVEIYQLNLGFTKITSPIDGQVSRYFYTLGNLVNQDQTVLTTVVSLDPMYVYFDMDEPTLIRIKRAINDGRIRMDGGVAKIPFRIRLQGEEGYPHEGSVDFSNNQVNSNTGSISFRGVFPNPKPVNGTRLLAPGMFVRVRLSIGEPHPAFLVIDRAIGSDQGLKYVYVVDDKGKILYRRITTGALQEDGLRAITSGLKDGDRVVTGGLQLLHSGMEVRPDEQPMPNFGPEAPAPDAEGTAKSTPAASAAGGRSR